MLDMSWGEVMVIGAVALIVIGPKDLPRALRTVGNVTGKIRRMAAEFQGQFQEAMREAELDDVKKQLQGVNESVSSLNTNFNPIQTIRDELKGAVDAPMTAHEKTPGEEAHDAAAQGRGEAGPPAPVDPAIALPIPSVPPIVDPAEAIAESLEREAEAERRKAVEAAAPKNDKPDAQA
ncbi:Sec-independent protein translocase protein TatB [Microvirga subterranea]|uniref:Sec-independent protein translocase protein TatB n=1 Tax=Microvirga subterranea TaxID=186651 RepID=A0A370HP28_9HYPH|nr:Sec-independent protein translocase protein TatB [Microvirga subterranea]RDI60100.1 sec-independent protein translocase protein TatB [Microvirga subterranea]